MPEKTRSQPRALELRYVLDKGELHWWTLSQRIRILAEMTFEVALLEIEEPPPYQRISDKTLNLNQLGLNMEAIARHLEVDGKTVAKALRWIAER